MAEGAETLPRSSNAANRKKVFSGLRGPLIILVWSISCEAVAENKSIDIDVLKDWKFRAYACKNALMVAGVLNGMEEANGIEVVENRWGSISPIAVSRMLEGELNYDFTVGEAKLVADVGHSIWVGLHASGHQPNQMTLMSLGFDICISAMDSFIAK